MSQVSEIKTGAASPLVIAYEKSKKKGADDILPNLTFSLMSQDGETSLADFVCENETQFSEWADGYEGCPMQGSLKIGLTYPHESSRVFLNLLFFSDSGQPLTNKWHRKKQKNSSTLCRLCMFELQQSTFAYIKYPLLRMRRQYRPCHPIMIL